MLKIPQTLHWFLEKCFYRQNWGWGLLCVHYCFLTLPPLFLHFLPFLISNSILSKSGKVWEAEAFFLQTKNGGHGKVFFTSEGPTGSSSVSIPLFFDNPQSWGEQVFRCLLGKKGNNIWIETLIINSAEELGFRRTRFQCQATSYTSFPSPPWWMFRVNWQNFYC